MKVHITYDDVTKKVKSAQTHYTAIVAPDLPVQAGVSKATILDSAIPGNDYARFLRNFDSFVYVAATQSLELTGALNARYIAPVARNNTIPLALGRASTVDSLGVL